MHKMYDLKTKTIQDLINILNLANEAYYNSDSPIMSDEEYDLKLEELQKLEKTTGIVFPNSPTQNVGTTVLTSLNKVPITPKPMLSLAKCHSYEEVADFAGTQEMIAMIKLDGLSVRIKYNNGKLISANTRGNGVEGTDITEHIKQFQNVPLEIPYEDEFIIDGEAIIKIPDFEEINKDGIFKNPRNAASGALNVLDTKLVKERKLSFVAWDVINGSRDLGDRFFQSLRLGFETVPFIGIHPASVEKIEEITDKLNSFKETYPCDGIVWKYRDCEYGDSLGQTSHHFKNGIAWKPEIEVVESELIDIDWTMGRSGVLTPVAVFEPVELDGSIIERASLHNLSIMRNVLHGNNLVNGWVGQKIKIFKANMVIPQVLSAEEDDERTKLYIDQPRICPICGEPLYEHGTDSITLVCENPNCSGKLINQLDHYCGKKGLDIKGISKATLEKIIDWGWVEKISDIYNLKDHREEWIKQQGFGEKSVDKILAAIEASKQTNLESFISAIGIPLIGRNVAKEICKHVNSYGDFRQLIKNNFDFYKWESFGPEKSRSLLTFDYEDADYISTFITFNQNEVPSTSNSLDGTVICITGKLHNYKNRTGLQQEIEARGGKVTSSVSSKTNYLVNNDVNSTSSKNTSAKKLGVEIITEEEFIQKFLH